METRYLGRTGLRVSELCLGTMSFGGGTDEPTAHQMLDRFVDAGGSFVDTADVYGAGVSEEILGRWLRRQSRDDLAGQTGRSAAQVALRWLMQQPAVTAPILGPRTLDQLEDGLAAAGTPLDEQHMARLTAVSDRPLPYPYGLLARFRRR
jgi:aryl-alcohol dehydrogenase-like predicted oxidoreductase